MRRLRYEKYFSGGDCMNAYQWKQEAFGAAVDRGLYNLASQIDETNTADFSGGIPWYIIRAIADEQQRLTPSKSPPERSGTTGHNQTLTRAQKCAIIVKKAIRRHVRRWKRKQEGKTMKNATVALNDTIRAQITSAEKELEKAMKNLDYEKAGEIEKEIESLKIQLEMPIPERKICF